VSESMYASLSWYRALHKDYAACIDAANRAIGLKPDDLVPQMNLAHCLLLTGRYAAAKEIYLRYKGQYLAPDRRWETIIAEDFAELGKQGIAHPRMQDIRNLLE